MTDTPSLPPAPWANRTLPLTTGTASVVLDHGNEH